MDKWSMYSEANYSALWDTEVGELSVSFLNFFFSQFVFYWHQCSSFDHVLPQWVELLLLRLLLGLQLFLVLIQPVVHGACLLGPQTQGLALLTFVEFPALVLFLVDDCENTGNGSANNLDLGELRSRATCHSGNEQLGQLNLSSSSSLSSSCFLPRKSRGFILALSAQSIAAPTGKRLTERALSLTSKF